MNPDSFVLPEENSTEYAYIANLFAHNVFFELKFDDYLMMIIKFMNFIHGLTFKFEVNSSNEVYLFTYGSDNNLKAIADKIKIKLQLKPYANYYYHLKNKINIPTGQEQHNNIDNQILIQESTQKGKQFHQLNDDDILLFPPYETYDMRQDLKFRRYNIDDSYHDCPNDPELNFSPEKGKVNKLAQKCCSNLRNIDRLRIINIAYDDKIMLYLKKYGKLKSVYMLRNFDAYEFNFKYFRLKKHNIPLSTKHL